jgi:hypothetical protein
MSRDIVRHIEVYTGKKRPPKKKEAVPPPERIPSPGNPTPERAAKESGFVKKVETPGNIYKEPEVSHKIKQPVEVYENYLTPEEIQAAEMIARDAHTLFAASSVTANYEGGSRSVPGPRHGGVADRNVDAYRRFEYVLKNITPGDRKAILALVLLLRSELSGRTTTMHEFARLRGANYAKEAAEKVALGLLKAALEHVYEAYRGHRTQTDRATNHSSVRPQIRGPRR